MFSFSEVEEMRNDIKLGFHKSENLIKPETMFHVDNHKLWLQ